MSALRTRWLAIVGSLLLLALSPVGALGHASSGQTEAFGSGNDVTAAVQGDKVEVTDSDDDTDTEGDELASAHGACVAAVAQTDTVGGLNVNHGGAVSEAARVTCWLTDEETPDEDGEEEDGDGEDPSTQPDNHGACVSAVAQSDAVGGPNANHGGAVSEAARVTCRASSDETPDDESGDAVTPDEDSAKDAAKDAEKAAKRAAKEQAKADKQASKDQAKADRQAAKDQAKADKQQAKADRKAAKEQAKADKRGGKKP